MKKYGVVCVLLMMGMNISFCFAVNPELYSDYRVIMNSIVILLLITLGYVTNRYLKNKQVENPQEMPVIFEMLIKVILLVTMTLSVQYVRDLPHMLSNETVKNLETGKVAINYKGEGYVQIKRHRFKVDLERFKEGHTAVIVYDALPHTDTVTHYVVE